MFIYFGIFTRDIRSKNSILSGKTYEQFYSRSLQLQYSISYKELQSEESYTLRRRKILHQETSTPSSLQYKEKCALKTSTHNYTSKEQMQHEYCSTIHGRCDPVSVFVSSSWIFTKNKCYVQVYVHQCRIFFHHVNILSQFR